MAYNDSDASGAGTSSGVPDNGQGYATAVTLAVAVLNATQNLAAFQEALGGYTIQALKMEVRS